MQYVLMCLCDVVTAGCCWYNVFRCCGCIDDGRRHVNIDQQIIVVQTTGNSKDNPFVPAVNPPPPKYKPDPNPFT